MKKQADQHDIPCSREKKNTQVSHKNILTSQEKQTLWLHKNSVQAL
jgi:hypothetical protein